MPKSRSTYKQREKLLKWIWEYSTAPHVASSGDWGTGQRQIPGLERMGESEVWAGKGLAGRKSPTSRRRLTESLLSRDRWGKPTTDRWKPVFLMFCKSAWCHTQKAERDSACPTRTTGLKRTQRKTQISDFTLAHCLIIINATIN